MGIINSISDYLSLLQLKYDCATVHSLSDLLKHDAVISLYIIPYITLTTSTALEMLESVKMDLQIPNIIQIKDTRLKLKIFENGYSKSKRMLLNIDYLQNEVCRNKIKFNFIKNSNLYYNLGILTDENNQVVGNTQYIYYLFQNNRFLKKNLNEVAEAYNTLPNKFDLNGQVKKECYDYNYTCGQIISSVHSVLENFDAPISISTRNNFVKYYYADYNTNIKSTLFPIGEDGKAVTLYLLHILSTINFLLYVINNCEKDDYGWWLKINYIAYYYTIEKLQDLQQHLIQNKLITSDITNYFNEINLKDLIYMNGCFRNYIMHSKLTDKNGNSIINSKNLDKTKPLFGLVETCFNGISYQELKASIISEMKRISDILSQWLNIQSIHTKPL